MQFAVDELKRNPNLTYVELKELATARGLLLPPILFGRAKLQRHRSALVVGWPRTLNARRAYRHVGQRFGALEIELVGRSIK